MCAQCFCQIISFVGPVTPDSLSGKYCPRFQSASQHCCLYLFGFGQRRAHFGCRAQQSHSNWWSFSGGVQVTAGIQSTWRFERLVSGPYHLEPTSQQMVGLVQIWFLDLWFPPIPPTFLASMSKTSSRTAFSTTASASASSRPCLSAVWPRPSSGPAAAVSGLGSPRPPPRSSWTQSPRGPGLDLAASAVGCRCLFRPGRQWAFGF